MHTIISYTTLTEIRLRLAQKLLAYPYVGTDF